MKHKNLIKSWIGFGGAVAFVLLMNFPGIAQVTPNSGASERGQADPARTPAAPSSRPMTSMSSLDQEFMKMAAHSDQFEIRTSQLALEKQLILKSSNMLKDDSRAHCLFSAASPISLLKEE
ncbi:MAG: hypothetical protein HC781_14860 [Leptolyngbyaceae cyanobacterium CSU_1_4]|nr:hypothetical protein [Leptolyngbyaceae cyanobacterium CSU_1_4]